MTHAHRSGDFLRKSAPPSKVRQVIEVEFLRGEGCCDEDMCRRVTAYFSLDGELLAERDPC